MTPIDAIRGAARLLPSAMFRAPEQIVPLMLSIQRHEAPNGEQKQIGGPAVSTYQMERGGAIREVMTNAKTRDHAAALCRIQGVPFTEGAVYAALQNTDDVLDAGFARLALWADRGALPAYGDVEGAWQYYLKVWRPGAYNRGDSRKRLALRSRWATDYAAAIKTFQQW